MFKCHYYPAPFTVNGSYGALTVFNPLKLVEYSPAGPDLNFTFSGLPAH